ncbi:MAG: NAD-dependent epimerase [Immundisolibacterales bacterium]|nr:NAD-dependent epimerase [Immundisolibacterales bacterium]
MTVLVTGAAGFIGAEVCRWLALRGDAVTGIDNLNAYYDVGLKKARLARLDQHGGFRFEKIDISDRDAMHSLFDRVRPRLVVHLAAQAGVRHSLTDPHTYADANLVGFLNVLEGCRHCAVEHLVFASTSSVYGANRKLPYSVHDSTEHPLSLYAASKKANELMAHAYSHLYSLPATGLRFFTVYGPWGRPDMSLFRFTRNILAGEPIDIYNHGRHRRDFTYVDDIVEGVMQTLGRPPESDPDWDARAPDPGTSHAPYRLLNIGNQSPIALERYVETIERCVGRRAVRRFLPLQPGDVPETFADIGDLAALTGYRPRTSIEEGVPRFVDWYRGYYGV